MSFEYQLLYSYALDLSPPSTSQSRPNRVFEWVHTQVQRSRLGGGREGLSPPKISDFLPKFVIILSAKFL